MFCRNCGTEMNPNAAVCVKCGVPVGMGGNYCNTCGAETNPSAVVCVKCGCPLTNAADNKDKPVKSEKSKLVAGLLGIFLGGIGVHNFYIGKTSRGAIQILVTIITCGAGFIWGLIEGIMILCSKDSKDGEGKLLQ